MKDTDANVAKSNEEDVVEAVRVHLKAAKTDVAFSHKFFGRNDKIVAEVDGVVAHSKFTALVEAKSNVSMSALDQLQRLCHLWAKSNRHGREVHGFVGGPLFDKGVKEEALLRGFSVVEVSTGGRYRVVDHELAGKDEPQVEHNEK